MTTTPGENFDPSRYTRLDDLAARHLGRLPGLAGAMGVPGETKIYPKHTHGDKPQPRHETPEEPAYANSVEDYWQSRRQVIGDQPGIEPTPTYDAASAQDAIMHFTLPNAGSHSPEAPAKEKAARDTLRVIAHTDTDTLRAWQHDPASLLSAKLPDIRRLAFDSGDPNVQTTILVEARSSARNIFAKLGDPKGLDQLRRDISERLSRTSSGYDPSLTSEPLGIYTQRDAHLRDQVISRATYLIGGAKDDRDWDELQLLFEALYASGSPEVADFVTSSLRAPDETLPIKDQQQYAGTVLHAAALWLPRYTSRLRAAPDSPQKELALRQVEEHVAGFFELVQTGGLRDLESYMVYPSKYLAPLLHSFNNRVHQDILRENVLAEFRSVGSVLRPGKKAPGDFDSFERAYLRYRAQYGDINEISSHIRRPGQQ